MKKFIWIVLALVAVAGVALFLNLGSAVKVAIETAGTRVAGTPVRVSGLDVSIADKTASMSGLSVANPKGFKTDALLKAKDISVAVDSISGDTVSIKEIVVDGMTMAYEIGAGGTNFDVIRKNLKSTKSTEDSAPGKTLIIQKLRIINAQVIPAIQGQQAPISLPDITLNNIGSKNSPATSAQVAAQIMNKVLSTATVAIVKSGLTSSMNNAMDKATEGLKGLLP